MRLLCAAVALSFGLIAAFADDKKPEPNSERVEQLAKLQMRFNEEMADLKKRLDRADESDRPGIQVEIKEQAIISSQSAIELAKEDPKDATGFAAALFVIEKAGPYGAGKEMAAAVGIIAEHHASNPKVKAVLPVIGKAGPAGKKFLEAAAETSTDKEVKGIALLYLGTMAAEQIDDGADAKKIEEAIAAATGYLDKAIAEAPTAKVGTSTVAKEAATQLENIKAIKFLTVGQPAPEIETTLLDGKKVKLSESKGKVVLLDFWATWCPPCRAMIPHERELVRSMEKKPFALVSVSVDAEKATLTEFLEKEPMPWIHWWQDGEKNPAAKKYRIRAFPTMYLIDHKGVIRHKWIGSPGNDAMDKAIAELVKDAEGEKK